MQTTAADHGVDRNRLSFTRSVHAARRSARTQTGISTTVLRLVLHTANAEIGAELLPHRRLRAAGSVVKRESPPSTIRPPTR